MKQARFTLVPFLLSLVFCLPAMAGFVEVTLPALGAEPGQIAGGSYAAWPDADSDGWPDLHLGGDILYLNNWDGTFTLSTGLGLETEWGYDYRMSWADADNDGDQDCVQSCDLVTTVGRTTGAHYFDNSGPGLSFSRSTIHQNPTNLRSETPLFFEADGNGACEIYQTIFGNWEPNYLRGPDRLFEASSPAVWADVTELRIPQLGNINFELQSRGAAACDYDGDLDLDVFVPVYGVSTTDPSWENLLWQNNGAGYFTDVAEEAGVHIEPHGRYGIGLASGASWGDYDNDGDFDLVVANIHGRAAIYRNEGDGTFYNTSDDDNGLPAMQNEWHSGIWVDHDNDGDLDLLLCQWYEHYAHLFENLGPEETGIFEDVTGAMGLEQDDLFRQVDCLAVADYDRDGDMDLYFHGGLDDLQGKHLLRNELDPDGSGEHWLVLVRQGTGTAVSGLLAVTGPGPAPGNPPTVRSPMAGWDAYGVTGYGVNVACADLDGDGRDELLSGPGPGDVLGPHVRAFSPRGAPVAGVSFFAYGTLKFGVNVAGGDLDGDGYDEIVTGAGPGAVFGPHVRGWSFDGATVSPLSAVNFFAYDGAAYGARVACADLDGDGIDEILTMPGPDAGQVPQLRAWNTDGPSLTLMDLFDSDAYAGLGLTHGGTVAGGRLH